MKKKIFILTLGLLCLTSSVAFASSSEKRIYGDSKYETSAKISSYGFEKSKYAILVNGEDFADGLSASPLAKKYNAPLLITPSKKLDNCIKSELQRLEVKNVIIVGGNGAVSNSVEDEIKSLGISTARISGKDRYDTSLEVAKEIGCSNGAFLTVGDNYADALSASSIAGIKQMPILLTQQNKLPDNISKFINERNNDSNIYILGSPMVISDDIDSNIKNSYRIYGADRYQTNISTIESFSDVFDISNVYLASGENFHDALCVSALASKNNSAVVLAPTSYNKHSDFLFYNSDKIKNLLVVGDENSVDNFSIETLCNTKNIKDFTSKDLVDKLNKACTFYRNSSYYDYNSGITSETNPYCISYKLVEPYETKEKLLKEFSTLFSRDFLYTLKFNKINDSDYIERIINKSTNYNLNFFVVDHIDYISDKYCVAYIWSHDAKFSFAPVVFAVEGSNLKVNKILDPESYYNTDEVFISFFDKIKTLNKEKALSALNTFNSYIPDYDFYKSYISQISNELKSFNGKDSDFSAHVENMKNNFIKFYADQN